MGIDLIALKSELLLDPASQGYASLVGTGDTLRLAERVNTRALESTDRWADCAVIQNLLMTQGVWGAIEVAAASGSTETNLRGFCLTVVRRVTAGGELRLANPGTQNIMTTLVAAGLATAAQRVDIEALFLPRLESRAERLFGEPVSAQQVSDALYRTGG